MSKRISYLEACSQMVEMPDASIPEWFLVAVGYVREDGAIAYRYVVSQKAPTAQVSHALSGMTFDLHWSLRQAEDAEGQE